MKTCSVDGCDGEFRAKGFCNVHYNRMRDNGQLDPLVRVPFVPRSCSIGGCDGKHSARGLCKKHYAKAWRLGEIKPLERGGVCPADGCERIAVLNGLCTMHRKRVKRLGTVELPPQRLCSVDGCGRVHGSNGLCDMHYSRQWTRTLMGRPGGLDDRVFLSEEEVKRRKSVADRQYREENIEKVKEGHSKWYRENWDEARAKQKLYTSTSKYKEKVNKKEAESRDALSDKYVKRMLGIWSAPTELIEAKRVQLRITRALREMVKTPAN